MKTLSFFGLSILFAFQSVWAVDSRSTIIVTSPDQLLRIEKPWDARYPAKLINTTTGKVVHEFPLEMNLYSFSFSRDGKKLAAMPELKNLGSSSGTQADPLFIFDVKTRQMQRLDFGSQIIPRGNAVKNSANPILEWSADGRFIAIDLEEGKSIGVIVDASNGRIMRSFGRLSGRVKAEAQLSGHASISQREWRDFEGDPVISMAWNPADPSVIAVSYEDGKVALVDLSKDENDSKSIVDISGLMKRAVVQRQMTWSPDGRYLTLAQYSKYALLDDDNPQVVISIFDSQSAAVVKRAAFPHPNAKASLSGRDLILQWDADRGLEVRSLKGEVLYHAQLESNQGPQGRICETALTKIGPVQRALQKLFKRF